MGKAKVICEKCNGTVESSEDLTTDIVVLSVVAYHEDCYVTDLKRRKGFLLSGQPLNSWAGNLGFILSIIIAIVSFIFFNDVGILFFVSLIPITYRLFSYFIYERPLKNLDNN